MDASVRICPSILSADFANLESELNRIDSADMVHVDVMDGHFVPNLTLGLPVVKRLVETSPRPLDIHLMIDNPDRWALDYARAGAFSVTFHAEAAQDPIQIARNLRKLGAKASLALKPTTNPRPYFDCLDEFDMVLVMTVEPGFGGQAFLPEVLPKLEQLRQSGLDSLRLEVDGGINDATIALASRAGADTFVSGSSVFISEQTPRERIAVLRALAVNAKGRLPLGPDFAL